MDPESNRHSGVQEQECSRAVLSAVELRMVDRLAVDAYGMSSLVLMENAGRGAADWLSGRDLRDQRILILCGSGNNGGDGLVIARHLLAREYCVDVLMVGRSGTQTTDNLINYRILERGGCHPRWLEDESSPIEEQIARSSLVVDAVLGTGGRGSLRDPILSVVRAVNRADVDRIAIDVPTGMDSETGFVEDEAVRSRATLTFVARKCGFSLPNASEWTGEVVVLPIGVMQCVVEEARRVSKEAIA